MLSMFSMNSMSNMNNTSAMRGKLLFNVGKPDYNELAHYSDEFQLYPRGVELSKLERTTHPNSIIHSVVSDVGLWREFPPVEGISKTIEFAERIGTTNVLFHLPSNEDELAHFNDGLEIVKLLDYSIHFEVPRAARITKEEILMMIERVAKLGYHFVPDSAHLHANGFSFDEVAHLIKRFDKSIHFVHLNGNAANVGEKDNHCPVFSPSNNINWIDEFISLLSNPNRIFIYEGNTDSDEFRQSGLPYEISTYERWNDFAKSYGFTISPYSSMLSY